MFILAIDGSSKLNTNGKNRRNNGRLTKLLNQALGAADAEGEFNNIDVETDIVYLHEVMKEFYRGDYEYLPEWIVETFNEMIRADAIIFGTPVQWYAMSDLMKSFVQYLTLLGDIRRELRGKTVGIISTCEEDGGAHTGATLALPLVDMSMAIAPNGIFYQNKHAMHKSEDKWQVTDHRLVGENVFRHAAQLAGKKIDDNDWELRSEV